MLIVGDFVLNTSSRKLYDKDKKEVSLAPTLFTLLKYFIDHQNQVLSKDAIIANVWKGKIVVEANVNQNIKKLRDVLGDSANNPKYIETVTGEGFRFIANSEEYKAAPVEDNYGANRPWMLYIAFSMLVIFILVYLVIRQSTQEKTYLKNLVPLTTLKGLEHYPHISPNKQFLLFSHKSNEQSSWDIYSKPLDKESYSVVVESDHNERFPAVSPDGTKLLFFRSGKGTCGLYVLEIDLITRKNSTPKLAKKCESNFELQRAEWINNNELFLSINEDLKSPASIYHYNLLSGVQKRISKPDSKGFGDYVIRYSRASDKLAYIRDIGWTSSEIWVYDRKVTEHRKIKTTSLKLTGLDWDEDGWIYFQSGNKEVSRITMDGSKEEIFARFSSKAYFPFMIDKNTMGIVTGDYVVVDIGEFDLLKNTNKQLISSSFNDYFGFAGNDFTGFISNRTGDTQIWIRDEQGNDIKLTNYLQSFEISDISASLRNDLIIFSKSGHINIIDKKGNLHFDSENYTNQAHINPVFDERNNRFLYAVTYNGEWRIESRSLDNPADKIVLLKGISARPCMSKGCYFYFKNKDPYLYRYSSKSNTSTRLANVGTLISVSEWDMLDDDNLIYVKRDKSKSHIVKLDLLTGKEVVLNESKSDVFSLDKKRKKLLTNISSQGNTNIMSFDF